MKFQAVAGTVQPILASYPTPRGPKPLSFALSLVGDWDTGMFQITFSPPDKEFLGGFLERESQLFQNEIQQPKWFRGTGYTYTVLAHLIPQMSLSGLMSH